MHFILPTSPFKQGHDTKIQITRVTIYQIRLREPFETQTIQPKKYLKWSNESEYNGEMNIIEKEPSKLS